MAHPLTLFIPVDQSVNPLQLLEALKANQPANDAALLKAQTVHYARFVLLDRSKPNLKFDPSQPTNTGNFVLAVITEYDNAFEDYVKQFIALLGDLFNTLLKFSADGQKVIPVQNNIDAFLDYVAANDSTGAASLQHDALFSAYDFSVVQILSMSGTEPASGS